MIANSVFVLYPSGIHSTHINKHEVIFLQTMWGKAGVGYGKWDQLDIRMIIIGRKF